MGHVVAVAAPIGGGKTTFVRALAEALGDARTLYFDNYEKMTSEPVSYLRLWLENGADFNEFQVPELPSLLSSLKEGTAAVDPATGFEILPAKHVIFEMPLGKEHRETARYIDLLVWIDIPLDIALARKIKEFTGILVQRYPREKLSEGVVWVGQYLDNYLAVIREVLLLQRRRVKPNADIVIDGRSDLQTAVRGAVEAIRARLP